MGSLQPGYKPSLVLIFASLGDIHAERYHKTKRKADLDEAIWATRLALSISSADHPLTTTLLNNLGNGLWRRYRSASQEDDLHQALYYSLQAVDSLSWEDSNLADVLGTLGAIRASLYDCRGDFQDLQEAISITRRSIDIATQCARTAPVIIFNNLGVYLWTQYRLTDHREDLDDSISTLVKAVKFPTENTVERVTCLINSGYVLTQRYHRTGQLQDLSCALEHAQEAVRLDPQNGDLTTLLKFLDRFIDQHREPISSVHCSESRWNLNRFSGKILMALFVLILIATIYAYHPRVELLLSIVAFPSGIIYHWLVSRRPNTEPRISKQYHFMPILSLREHIGTLGKSKEFTPKVLEVPLIPVPSVSSLRGIQTSNFSAYTSALYHQRRQSIHPVKTGLVGESRFLTDRHRAKEEKVHKTKYRGHRLMSLPRLSHDEIPTISAKTPGVSGKCESPKNSVPSVLQIARLPAEVQLSRNEMGSAYRQPETHVVGF
ncbi:hypothetical protein N7533_013614 [Penicillium manginii]|uniref:uncharacterized protein n=1 Tax=Penicillium manginii TaxID=203109 RepID=UPI002548BE3C|nr:uncharacterized protein N7533_013614 [Penicillium manginii]KAJ5733167.1 hypothetical protein N7533_013614 [Penicillium manginii]